MTARFKDFGTPASSDEPVTFRLHGEVFRCVPAIQGVVLIEFIAAAGGGAEGNMAATAEEMLRFFNRTIIPADRERFTELLNSDDRIVSLEGLVEIMDWLVEQYAGRPTQQPTPSQPGEQTTGTMPVAVPSPPLESVSVI